MVQLSSPLPDRIDVKKISPLLLGLFLVLAACEAEPTLVPNSNPSPVPTTPPTSLVPATLVPNTTSVAAPSPVVSPLPTTARGPGGSIVIAGVGVPSREITALPEFVSHGLFDSLLRINPQTGDLIPGLAERWLVSEDAKTFVFILRNNVEWHNGTSLTAEDVVFTLQALSNPDIRLNPAADFGPISAITATDARTVTITFREAYCAALTYIGTIPILPQHRLEEKALTNVENEDLVGTGPLVLEEWDEDMITFTRNPNYWNGAPQIVDWTYRVFPDERAARDAVRQGRADFLIGDSTIEDVTTTPLVENAFYALALNVSRKPFDDVRVRQAIASALDRSQFTQQFTIAVPIETSLLPPYWALPSNISQPKFDAARARQLLTQSGLRDSDGDGILEQNGKPLEVTLWAQAEEPRSEVGAQMVREQLARVGVRAVLKLTDRTLFLTRVFLQEYDLAFVHFNIPLDPDQHYFWASEEDDPGFGLNVTGYSNARIDQALTAGNQVARCEPVARKNAYAPVFQQIAQDTPMVFLFAPVRSIGANVRVGGIVPSPFVGAYWNLNMWQVSP
jgi:peptide/nickel transport system substrate-binding protein